MFNKHLLHAVRWSEINKHLLHAERQSEINKQQQHAVLWSEIKKAKSLASRAEEKTTSAALAGAQASSQGHLSGPPSPALASQTSGEAEQVDL